MSRHHAFVAPIDKIEWRESRTGKSLTLTGHAAVFDRWSEELSTFAGKFREKIAPGAFRKVLTTNPDVRLLFNHDENFPLARTKSGTLELVEDDHGLAVKAQLGATSYANDLKIAMERGDVDQMSFAFTVADDEWDDTDEETVTRTIRQVDKLFDVSVVTYPAYPDTDAAMRELRKAAEDGKISAELPDLEEKTVKFPLVGGPTCVAGAGGSGTTVHFYLDGKRLSDVVTAEQLKNSRTRGLGLTIASEEAREVEDLPQDTATLEENPEPGDADQPNDEPVEEPPAADEPAVEEASEAHLLAELREHAQNTVQDEKRAYLRLLREITK